MVVVAAAVLLTQRKESTSKPDIRTSAVSEPKAPEPEPDFRAVAIKLGDTPCASVLKLADQPFLVASAPLLPLKDCGQSNCGCSYERRDDRRSEDRRHPFGSLSNNRIGSHFGAERRGADRRAAMTED